MVMSVAADADINSNQSAMTKDILANKIVTAWCLLNNCVPSPDTTYKNGEAVVLSFDSPKWLDKNGFTGIPSQPYNGPELKAKLLNGSMSIKGGTDDTSLDYLRYYLGFPTQARVWLPDWADFTSLTKENFTDYDAAVELVGPVVG